MSSRKRGLRCEICTGCGLCPGVRPSGAASVGMAVPGTAFREAGSGGTADRLGESGSAVDGSADAGCARWAAGRPGSGREAGVVQVLAGDALGGKSRPLGGCGRRLAAVDVGTTTIAMLLYREDGSVADRYVALNPQAVYGADVLSRIQAAEDKTCREEMYRQVRGILEKGVRRFGRLLQEGESLYMVLAANTAMTYLLMGWDSVDLGRAPFTAGHLSAAVTEAAGVPCFVFPGMSAFVGGDITAGVHACGMAEREEITLLVDLGTNGEMVLGNCRRRIACATAAGPAFEGGANRGIWGADMVGLLAVLLEEGIVDGTGLLAPEFFEEGIRIGNVLVTQQAIRSVQLAKGAIAAGMEVLLQKYGIEPRQVDRVVLAGGFGYYLNPRAAARIGLLPRLLAEKAFPGGNTALAGALRAGRELFAGLTVGRMLEKTAEGTEVINLALEPDFESHYLQRMNFY